MSAAHQLRRHTLAVLLTAGAGLLAAAGGLLAAGCGRASASDGDRYQGIVELDEKLLGFEVGGRIRELGVKRGDDVTPGMKLVALDDAVARAMADARAAEARAARAEVALLEAGSRAEDVRALAAELDVAREGEAELERSLKRQKELATRGVSGAAAVEELESQLTQARGRVRSTSARLASLRSGARPEAIAAAEARAAAAEAAALAEQERVLRHVLTADAAGVVLEVLSDPGETVAAGTPVLIVADAKHPFVDVFVPQARLEGIRVGAAAEIRTDASPEPLAGVVEDVGRKTEFTPRWLFSERERPNLVVRVRVRVEDPSGRLHAGVPAFVAVKR